MRRTPGTPDFDRLAKQLVPPELRGLVVDALRLVWKAHGAADIAKLETAFEGRSGYATVGGATPRSWRGS